MTTPASVALVLPGEAMWGAFQSGFAIELGARLQAAGHGEMPFSLAVGSSSGSLVATVAAAGGPFDHERIRKAWLEFGRATRIAPQMAPCLMRGAVPNPYPEALRMIFENGLVDTARAYRSRTPLVVTASHYEASEFTTLRHVMKELLWTGAGMLLAGPSDASCQRLASQTGVLLEAGSRVFAPSYYSSKPWPTERPAVLEDGALWHYVRDEAHMRRAVEASSRIPLLYGGPILDEAQVMIDGVFTDNAPVALALEHGARHVFVVTSSKKGKVFDKPVQSLLAKQVRSALDAMEAAAVSLNPFPRGRRFRAALKEIALLRDMIPEPAPIDIQALEARYPGQKVHVIHPPKGINVNRFFETSPAVLGRLYDLGVEKARDVALS